MEEHIVKILKVEKITHDVKRFSIEKPEGYSFIPGQATELTINKPGFRDKRNPFTFTGLNSWPELEFTIKIYNNHDGVTRELGKLVQGDEVIIHDVWGAITYNGPGVFIAGGAGVTPFIAIFRDLYSKNQIIGNSLILSNKTPDDIILKDEFSKMLGDNFYNIFTRVEEKIRSRIDEAYIKTNINNFEQNFYICGPDPFVQEIRDIITGFGARTESIIFEK
jgi:ferredoxin-NADP reductase